jgi:hypothetical protein
MTKTTQADAVKFYARRDSATTVLRKMGIHARDHNAFIEVMSDGQFACHIARAEMHLESLKNPKAAEPKAARLPRPLTPRPLSPSPSELASRPRPVS